MEQEDERALDEDTEREDRHEDPVVHCHEELDQQVVQGERQPDYADGKYERDRVAKRGPEQDPKDEPRDDEEHQQRAATQRAQEAGGGEQDAPGSLLFGDGLHGTVKQYLAHAEREEVQDRPNLVEPTVNAAVMAAQVVLGEDDVLVVEDLHADD